MYDAIYPVLGKQTCYPFYLSGVGISAPEFHTVRENGLISHQILFTLEGEGIVKIDGKSFIQKKGSVFYVASGIPHEYYPLDGKWSTCWVVFRGESLSVLMKRLGFSDYICKKTSEIDRIGQMFDRIMRTAKDCVHGDERCSLLVYEYIMMVRKALLLEENLDSGSVIDVVLRYLDENYTKEVTLGEMADLCHVSEQHFCRLFKEKIGMRPMEYLARKRILEAKVLLHDTEESITGIGKKVGYDDPTYFGMVFKKYEGVSPSQYRKLNKSVVL